jgi:diguanylate cyclase (GGDEF)-like protein
VGKSTPLPANSQGAVKAISTTKTSNNGLTAAQAAAAAAALAARNKAAADSANASDNAGSDAKKSGGDSDSEKSGVRRHAALARAVDGIPLVFRGALLGLIFATSMLAIFSFRERRRAMDVARVAQLDHLTGLANREGFDRQMGIEWHRALRYGRPLGMVFVDLDHFKTFNDTHGHVAGDRLLREIAAAINTTARGSDFTARLGGDEFVILCPETSPEGLARLSDRLKIEAAALPVGLSIGYAHQLPTDEQPEDLIHRADESMYRAKGGRRRSSGGGNPMLGSMRRGVRS